jgi:hypothetical protein
MPRAPSARIQACHKHEAKAAKDAAGIQVARQGRTRQPNPRNNLARNAHANCRRVEEEVEQHFAYEEGANYHEDETGEDYEVEEEQESEEVDLELEEEEQDEQELCEPSMDDLVAVMANQTRLLEVIA